MALLSIFHPLFCFWATKLKSLWSPPVKPALQEPGLESRCLQDILKSRSESGKGSVVCYTPRDISCGKDFTYRQLHTKATECSRIVRAIEGFRDGSPVLLHFDSHWDVLVWFWAVLLANGLPVLSSPFSHVEDHRRRHISGLSTVLQSPICLLRSSSSHLFDGVHSIRLHTIESLLQKNASAVPDPGGDQYCTKYQGGQALAMLMLTSGSTGNAKAVRLTHRQVLSAISGKSSVRALPRNGSFFNWVGLDHVASLVEIHIQALWLDVDQIHAHPADIVSSPTTFFDLLDRHRVCRTFAPNFFLAKLVATVASEPQSTVAAPWDLSSLTVVASGGEANDVKTCVAASALFETYGACQNVITPGFGMTETCAGSIFNLECPSYDVANGYKTANLGRCMDGIEMRVTVPMDQGGPKIAAPGNMGNLEVRGAVVFDGYYRDQAATAGAFPYQDGWFRTGDQACINSDGNLRLIGRTKEVVIINGVKVVVADIESLLDQALNGQVDRYVIFPSRTETAHTEQITIIYVPKTWPQRGSEMAEIERAAVQACITGALARPMIFALRPLSVSLMPMSALGKISKTKMRSLFESGTFDEDVRLYIQTLVAYKKQHQLESGTIVSMAETLLLDDVAKTLNIDSNEIDAEALFFELGFTSLDLIRLKHRLDTRLGISVPVITLMRNPTARSLAAALSPELSCGATVPYDPVLTFKSTGSKVPLWLVHPGVGEVLVFVGLAQQLADDDRPIYALRARGFELGQRGFQDIEETINVYTQAIRQRQKRGPYVLAGYSYGTMLAFEISKRLDILDDGTAVGFLGSFNLPPHIKTRMRQLSWNMCLLHLAYFLALTSEEFADKVESTDYPTLARHESLAYIVGMADSTRMAELGLEDQSLSRWADVAYGLQSMAMDYEPEGMVNCIDVFQAVPLKVAAASREDWLEQLGMWRDFSRSEPVFHAVQGAHYTMLGPEYVASFAATLKEAMGARGV